MPSASTYAAWNDSFPIEKHEMPPSGSRLTSSSCSDCHSVPLQKSTVSGSVPATTKSSAPTIRLAVIGRAASKSSRPTGAQPAGSPESTSGVSQTVRSGLLTAVA